MVIGHHHPLHLIEGRCGVRAPVTGVYSVPRWIWRHLACRSLRARERPPALLFVPAFNELAGYDILKIIKNPFSPLSRCMKQEEAEIILADGTFIGPLCAILIPMKDD